MPKCWSLSTTIRNPERNIPFLKILKEFEGQNFTENIQAAYFKRLVQTKNYKPTGLPSNIEELFEKNGELSEVELKELLSSVHYENKQYKNDQEKIYSLRGRTAVGNLNKMGLAIAKQNTPIKVFDLGNNMLTDSVDFENIMFKYFLKWQLDNPIEDGFSDFNIIPFIATLHVINRVNLFCQKTNIKAKGLSRDEFAFFIPTLTNYKNIDDTVKSIITFRENSEALSKVDKRIYIDNFSKELVINTFGINQSDDESITKWISNLYDYGDSIRRYFRQTGFVYYRGNGYYTDLSPSRIVEINSILNTYDGSALEFSTEESYLDYLGNISLPKLPWENLNTLNKIYSNLIITANNIQNNIRNQFPHQELHSFILEDLTFSNFNEANIAISKLRNIIKTLKYDLAILEERNLKNLTVYIEHLNSLANRKRDISGQDPLMLEQFSALSLMALDDAKEIRPNYTLGDDNLPTFTAKGNVPDIECYYESFNMICEVTLLKSRDQWFNEGQPVMRHFRDFEDTSDKENYCLFIAPILHRDAINNFWISVKYEFEGKKQKIVPLSILQYNNILSIVLILNNKYNYRINHKDIKELLENLYNSSSSSSSSVEWISNFDNEINSWKVNLISKI